MEESPDLTVDQIETIKWSRQSEFDATTEEVASLCKMALELLEIRRLNKIASLFLDTHHD